jgi:hypothetical protein
LWSLQNLGMCNISAISKDRINNHVKINNPQG